MTRTQMCLNYEGLVFPVCPGLFFFRTTIVVGFFMFVGNDCFFYFRLFGKPFFGSLGSTTLKNWGRVIYDSGVNKPNKAQIFEKIRVLAYFGQS